MTENHFTYDYTSFLDLEKYQKLAKETAIYDPAHRETYPLLGLMGEVGEYCNKYKKVLRDGSSFSHKDKMAELGDILWYLALVAEDADLSLGAIAAYNINKLQDRAARNVLGGSGDNR